MFLPPTKTKCKNNQRKFYYIAGSKKKLKFLGVIMPVNMEKLEIFVASLELLWIIQHHIHHNKMV
jgi:hypothetical protein